MNRISGWRQNGAVSASFAFVLVVAAATASRTQAQPIIAQLQPAPGPGVVESTVQDAGAPPQVKAQLDTQRQTIKASGFSFYVGYNTSVSALSIEQLAGTRPPPELPRQIRQQNRVASTELAKRPALLATIFRVGGERGSPDPTLAKFDWSQRDVVSSVKTQLFCGACWDFASVGVFEAMYAIRNGKEDLLDLSEEQVLRCNNEQPNKGSCCGGWWAFDFIQANGLVGRSKLPYASGGISCSNGAMIGGTIAPCSTVGGRLYKAATWAYVGDSASVPPREQIKNALCDHGPLIAAVRVTDLFKNYKSGLFDEHDTGPINHAIMIVGWTEQGWIVKNSWGPSWGANGYILVAYDSNSIGFGAAWVEPEIFSPK